MYKIAIVSSHAPKSGGGKYRRPVDVRVYNYRIQTTEYAKTGKGKNAVIYSQWRNVDCRYHGPKSAYGKAINEAKELVQILNVGM